MRMNELVLYRDTKFHELLGEMVWLSENCESEYYNTEDVKHLLFESVNQLIELANEYGLSGNLWHGFLALLLVDHENAFSTAWEVNHNKGTLNEMALHDFEIIRELLHIDFQAIGKSLNSNICALLDQYQNSNGKGKIYDDFIRGKIHKFTEKLSLASNKEEIFEIVTDFYRSNGVGKFGLHKAFRVISQEGQVFIEPITNVEEVRLNHIVGYERQKSKLTDNTDAFVGGRAANNTLLFGDSGTGKSSSIKAILNEYYDRGLRMIEIYKHQFQDLSAVIEQIKDRNYKFIIYMDDLSFEDFELEYKYLKAIIEGGLGKKPDNVLIYATSNRRHLIREKFSDKPSLSDELHVNDTVQEKLSLAARFGVTIYYGSPDKKEFMNIVKQLSERYDIDMDLEQLYEEANQWELTHGGFSGRTATQFITHLLGKVTKV